MNETKKAVTLHLLQTMIDAGDHVLDPDVQEYLIDIAAHQQGPLLDELANHVSTSG